MIAAVTAATACACGTSRSVVQRSTSSAIRHASVVFPAEPAGQSGRHPRRGQRHELDRGHGRKVTQAGLERESARLVRTPASARGRERSMPCQTASSPRTCRSGAGSSSSPRASASLLASCRIRLIVAYSALGLPPRYQHQVVAQEDRAVAQATSQLLHALGLLERLRRALVDCGQAQDKTAARLELGLVALLLRQLRHQREHLALVGRRLPESERCAAPCATLASRAAPPRGLFPPRRGGRRRSRVAPRNVPRRPASRRRRRGRGPGRPSGPIGRRFRGISAWRNCISPARVAGSKMACSFSRRSSASRASPWSPVAAWSTGRSKERPITAAACATRFAPPTRSRRAVITSESVVGMAGADQVRPIRQAAGQLLQEERHAVRSSHQRVAELWVQLRGFRQAVRASNGPRRCSAGPGCSCPCGAHLGIVGDLGSGAHHNEDGSVASCDQMHRFQRAGVGPVRVLDHEESGPRSGLVA